MKGRSIGLPFEGECGPKNCITDVPGVEVGQLTAIKGASCRTGVTAVFPRGKEGRHDPVHASCVVVNGNGEMTGTQIIADLGFLHGPLALTNTNQVGLVRDAIVTWLRKHGSVEPWSCPLVSETWDGRLNDIEAHHLTQKDVFRALDDASDAAVANGNTGGGTGMICFELKGGTGTASQLVDQYTVGVLVQANFGRRDQLRVCGVPVGKSITHDVIPTIYSQENGSIVVVIATDAPLLPHQLNCVARRSAHGIARTGGVSGISSGDLAVAFSTANKGLFPRLEENQVANLECVSDSVLDAIFQATARATEEAILNAMLCAEDMTGFQGNDVRKLPLEMLKKIFDDYRPPKLTTK